jgi:DNA topoisomerase VI subunit B
MQSNALRDAKTRRSKLIRYVPDVSRSLIGLLVGMRQRRTEIDSHRQGDESSKDKLCIEPIALNRIIQQLDKHQITAESIHSSLVESIDTETPNIMDNVEDDTDVGTKVAIAAAAVGAVPLYLVPLFNLDDSSHDIIHPLFTFRPIVPLPYTP